MCIIFSQCSDNTMYSIFVLFSVKFTCFKILQEIAFSIFFAAFPFYSGTNVQTGVEPCYIDSSVSNSIVLLFSYIMTSLDIIMI